uniref:Uncharacterized protein n=1 Tax=Plectus sambesii TaxID=2011161 RepID=A0A914USK8_9BILA
MAAVDGRLVLRLLLLVILCVSLDGVSVSTESKSAAATGNASPSTQKVKQAAAKAHDSNSTESSTITANKRKPTTDIKEKSLLVSPSCNQITCNAKCRQVFGDMDPDFHGVGKCEGAPLACKCDIAPK